MALAVEDEGALSRLLAFSDGVFAIAITLLVLDVKLPDGTTKANLTGHLAAIWPTYLAFGFTFLVIGLRWFTHHIQFQHIRRCNNPVLVLNLLLLLSVVFLPFPARVLSEYPDSRSASVLYAAAIAIAGLLSTLLWVYAYRVGKIVDYHEPNSQIPSHRDLFARFIVLPILLVISIVVAFAVPGLWPARGIALAAPLVQILMAGYQYRRRQA
jgi:uncharacterized membrane protein